MKSAIILISAILAIAKASIIIGPSVYNAPITLSRSPYIPPHYSNVHSVPVIAGPVVGAPIAEAPVAAAPVATHVAVPVAPHLAESPIVSAPVSSFYSDEAIIAGPSGTITTKKISAKPGIVRYPAPAVAAQVDRQYLPPPSKYSSNKYASRRKVQLVASPYGPVPAGHGAEGLYVRDYKEKYYDDGSYRPEHQ